MNPGIKLFSAILMIGIFSILVIGSRPKLVESPVSIDAIEKSFRQMVNQNQPPGMSVVVIKDGSIVYDSAFGMADIPNQIAATPETIYHWWSMTKITTAIAILQLHDVGLLDINDPVIRYLPYFEVALNGNPAPNITIRQLLRHSSGLPDPMPAMIGWVHFKDKIFNQTELLQQHLPNYNKLKFEPDSKSGYSNLGYMVLGAIVEKVTGEHYEDYIENHILSPLGMNDTGFLYPSDLNEKIAAGSHPLISIYTPLLPFLLDLDTLVNQRIGGTFWFNPVYTDVTPSSGLLGTSRDAAKLALSLLEQEKFLTESSHLLLRPQGEKVYDLPLGWAEFNTGDRLWVQHRGGGPGFASIMRLYPDERLGIIIMANNTNLPSEKLVNALADIDWSYSQSKGILK